MIYIVRLSNFLIKSIFSVAFDLFWYSSLIAQMSHLWTAQ